MGREKGYCWNGAGQGGLLAPPTLAQLSGCCREELEW